MEASVSDGLIRAELHGHLIRGGLYWLRYVGTTHLRQRSSRVEAVNNLKFATQSSSSSVRQISVVTRGMRTSILLGNQLES